MGNGWVSRCYGERAEAGHAIYSVKKTGPVALMAVISPTGPDELSATIAEVEVRSGKASTRVTPQAHDLVFWSTDCVAAEGVEATDFEWGWIRRKSPGGAFVRAALLHGTRLLMNEMRVVADRRIEHMAIVLEGETLKIDTVPPARLYVFRSPAVNVLIVNGRMRTGLDGHGTDICFDEVPAASASAHGDGF
jgi:hypothetical protein